MGEYGEEFIREACLDNEEMKKIFVAGIPSDCDDNELKTFFEGISGGEVTDHQVIRKEGSEKKNLFGFVTFASSELVDAVLLQRGSLKFNGKDLEVNRAVPKTNKWIGAHEKTKKLFIANLPKTCTEDELREYFDARHPKSFGTIESIQLIKKKNEDGSKTDENKGYGFVFVTSEDMADKMAIQHSSFQFGGRKIELKKSVPTAEGGQRGRGRGRGGDKGSMRGGGGQFQGYGQQNYGGGYGGQWGADPYAAAAYSYDGYNNGYSAGGGYGYGAPAGGGGRGRGGAAQGNRFQPY